MTVPTSDPRYPIAASDGECSASPANSSSDVTKDCTPYTCPAPNTLPWRTLDGKQMLITNSLLLPKNIYNSTNIQMFTKPYKFLVEKRDYLQKGIFNQFDDKKLNEDTNKIRILFYNITSKIRTFNIKAFNMRNITSESPSIEPQA